MFPIVGPLGFYEIGDYWAREHWQLATSAELENLLEAAWRRGDVSGTGASRLGSLRVAYKQHSTDEVVFVVANQAGPPMCVDLDDGGRTYDFRPRIPVPSSDLVSWTDDDCVSAFEAIAENWNYLSTTKSVALILPALASVKLTRDQFMEWGEQKWGKLEGYHRPTFWAPSVHAASSSQQPTADSNQAGNQEESIPSPSPATDSRIRNEMKAVYDEAEVSNSKPPNIKEIGKAVRSRLAAVGLTATVYHIEQIADEPQHKQRRWPRGKRRSG